MTKITEIIKDEIKSYKNSIELIIGFFVILAGISTLTTKIFESKINIAIILIGTFFLIRKICNKIINENKEISANSSSKHSLIRNKIVRIGKILNYSLLIIPLFLVFFSFFESKKGCGNLKKSLGIVITNFSLSSDDDFSHMLFSLLQTNLENYDTINIERVSIYVNTATINYKDSIKQVFFNSCFNHGLLVSGKRSIESKLFDCSIHIFNLFNLNSKIRGTSTNDLIYIQNPDLLNFSIDYQANIISEFIQGLLFYNSNLFENSINKFNESLKLNDNNLNRKFISTCKLFIGNCYYLSNNLNNAIREYKEGIRIDSLNSYLHFNLAVSYLINSDTSNANIEYNKAIQINKIHKCTVLNFTKDGTISLNNPKKVRVSVSPVKDPLKKNKPFSKDKSIEQKQFNVFVLNKKYGMYDRNGDTIIKPSYDTIGEYLFNKKYYFIVKQNSKFGALNQQGKIEIPIVHKSFNYVKTVIKVTLIDPKSIIGI